MGEPLGPNLWRKPPPPWALRRGHGLLTQATQIHQCLTGRSTLQHGGGALSLHLVTNR